MLDSKSTLSRYLHEEHESRLKAVSVTLSLITKALLRNHTEHASRTHHSTPPHLAVKLWDTTRSSSTTMQFKRLMLSLCTCRIFAPVWDVQGSHLKLKLFPGRAATINVRSRYSPFLHWHCSGPRGWGLFSRLNTSQALRPWRLRTLVVIDRCDIWTFGDHTSVDTPSPVFLYHNSWNPTWVFIQPGTKVKNHQSPRCKPSWPLRFHGLFRLWVLSIMNRRG